MARNIRRQQVVWLAVGVFVLGSLDGTHAQTSFADFAASVPGKVNAFNRNCCPSYEQPPKWSGGGTPHLCAHPISSCTLGCAHSLFELTDQHVPMLNLLFTGNSNQAIPTVVRVNHTCSRVSVPDVLHALEAVRGSGDHHQCTDAQLNGVSETPLRPPVCKDQRTGLTCAALIASGVFSCRTDLCPSCPVAHQCDLTCGICAKHRRGQRGGAAQHRRRAQLDTECLPTELEDGTKRANAACCDTAGCKAGRPTSCDAKCAVHFVPLYSKCSHTLAEVSPSTVQWMEQMHTTCTEDLPLLPLLRAAATCSSVGNGGSNLHTPPEIGCRTPPDPVHGVWMLQMAQKTAGPLHLIAVGTTVPLSCDPGYVPSGLRSASIRCDSVFGNGQWTGGGLGVRCVDLPAGSTCLRPVEVPDGTWSTPPFDSYDVGIKVVLICNAGYTLVSAASATMTCDKDGIWEFEGAYAQCKKADHVGNVGCEEPTRLSHGSWSTNPFADRTSGGLFVVGTIRPLRCEQGYVSSIPGASITCDNILGIAQWSGSGLSAQCAPLGGPLGPPPPPPPPQGPMCLSPVRVEHGTWSNFPWGKGSPGKYPTGVKMVLTCNAGYTLVSAAHTFSMTCNKDGLWAYEGVYAQCKATPKKPHDCFAPLDDVAHGTWSKEPFGVYSAGAQVVLTCAAGYIVVPASAATMVCDSEGRWIFTGEYAKCVHK